MFYKYNIVDDTTGQIMLQIGADLDNDPNAVTDNTPVGMSAYQGEDTDTDAEWYYVSGVKTARPLFSSVATWNKTTIDADGVDTATLSGLPNPTNMVVQVPMGKGLDLPGPFTETSGSFSLTTTVAGTYLVLVEAFPYQTAAFQIEAV